MFGCALFNAFGMNLLTIARQSYKLAFVMIISYSTLVYAFIADLAVFHVVFNAQQLIGAAIVLAFNVWAVVDKFINSENPPKPEPVEEEKPTGEEPTNTEAGKQMK